MANVLNTVPKHHQPINAEAPGKAWKFIGVDTGFLQDIGWIMPQPPSSIQPVWEQTLQPAWSQRRN